MIPDVTGMPLEAAQRTLDEAGVRDVAVRASAPPEGTGRPPAPDIKTVFYVASVAEAPGGGIDLRVVSVPAVDTDAEPGAPSALRKSN